jgi:NitT/TauT family transport system substrate-binding protein
VAWGQLVPGRNRKEVEIMKRALMTALIAVSIAGLGVRPSFAADPVKMGYLPIVLSLPTFVAAEKGLFLQEGVEVELIPFQSGTTIMDAVVTGRIDADCGSAITGHWFAEQNVSGRLRIFLGYGSDSLTDNTFVVVVKKDSPVKGLEDLGDKKVGTFPGGTSIALAKAVIRTKTDPEKVSLMEIPPPNMVPALAAGQIDAFFAPEPFGMMAVSGGVGAYLIKSPLSLLGMKSGIVGGGFSFSTKFLKERPDLAAKVMAALEKAVDEIRTNEQGVRGYLTKYAHLPEPVAMRIPLDKWFKMKELDKGAAQAYFEILYKEGAYKKHMDTTQLYYQR